MAGLDYQKVAEGYERRGMFKKAGDFYAGLYSQGRNIPKAVECYKKALANTRNPLIVGNIKKRIKTLNLSGKDMAELTTLIESSKRRSLEGRVVYGIISILCLVFSFMFVSTSFTGNAILQTSKGSANLFGLCFFACGLFFLFLYSRKK